MSGIWQTLGLSALTAEYIEKHFDEIIEHESEIDGGM